jgi:iron complex outermembrane recepter protein
MNRIASVKPLAAAIMLALPVLAQAQNQLEEVVVTAQKRTESLVDVPISIAAVTAEALEQTGVRNLGEIAQYVPNLEIGGSSNYNTVIAIRGVGSQSRNIGFDSRVGVYVDGVYAGQSPASNQDILDLERVEVLRGPQGTLFGKNNVAGAISMITKKPEQEFGGSVRAEFGNYSSQRFTGMLNVPLGDKVFTKISINDQQRDGFTESVITGTEGGEQDSTSARFQLLALLTDSLEMNFSADWTETDQYIVPQRSVAVDAGLIDPALREFKTATNYDNNEDREIKGAALTFDWSLDSGYVVKSITGYRETSHQTIFDLDSGVRWGDIPLPPPFPPLSVEFAFGINSETFLDYAEDYEQLTQEFQLLSPTDQALTWVAGLYYYDQEGETARDALSEIDPEHPLYASGALPWPGDLGYTLRTSGTVDTTAYAAFFNGNWQATDDLTFGFGARYTDEDKDIDYTMDASGSPNNVLGVPGVTLNAVFSFPTDRLVDDRNDSHTSVEASVRYALNEEMNIYYRYATGFKSGGFNADFVTQAQWDAGLEFDKEEVDSHEIGIKGELWDRRVTFGAALFYSTFDDYQVQQFLESADSVAGAAVIGNAAEVETKGLEIEVKAVLMENLIMDAAFGYLDAEFKDFPGGDKDEDGKVLNLKGYRLPGSSEYSFNMGLQYYLPIESIESEMLFRVDYAYSSDIFGAGNNREEEERTLDDGSTIDYLYLDDRTSVNGRIGLASMEDTWSVSIWGRNLTDENNGMIGEDIFGTYGLRDTLPRTYGVEFAYNF